MNNSPRRKFLTTAMAVATLPFIGPAIAKANEVDPKRLRKLAKFPNYGLYPYTPTQPKQATIDSLVEWPNVHVIAGMTGSGKTTVLHAVAKAWVARDPKNNAIIVDAANRPVDLGPNITQLRPSDSIISDPYTLVLLDLPELWALPADTSRWAAAIKHAEKCARWLHCPVIVTRQLPLNAELRPSDDSQNWQSYTVLNRRYATEVIAQAWCCHAHGDNDPYDLIRDVLPLDLTRWHADHPKGA